MTAMFSKEMRIRLPVKYISDGVTITFITFTFIVYCDNIKGNYIDFHFDYSGVHDNSDKGIGSLMLLSVAIIVAFFIDRIKIRGHRSIEFETRPALISSALFF